MKFRVLTLGCKTNQAESFKIEKILSEAGHKLADFSEKPDICIINTCAVTSKADQQSKQLINKCLKNNIKVVVTGCYSELNHDKLISSNPEITVISNNDKLKLLDLLLPRHSLNPKNYFHPRHRPVVKVQDGCDNSCTYCVIPLARGRARSLPIHEVINEIKYYESLNYKEIVLTGIHLGSYGADLNPKITLSRLLKKIIFETRSIRFRLSSIESNEIDDELLEVLSENRICKHLHIPLQSGDEQVLRAMNRKYTVNEYVTVINKILNRFNSDIGLGTDVIVGFPGEDDVAFANTKLLLEELPFSYLHIFPFSKRTKTKAATFSKQIDEKTKKARAEALRFIGESKKVSYIHKNIGKIKKVILENKTNSGFMGTSEDYIKVYLPKIGEFEEGMLIEVMIDNCEDSIAIGLPFVQLKTLS